MKNGISLIGVYRILQVKCDLPEFGYAKEIQFKGHGTLMVVENAAAEEGAEFVLWQDGPMWESVKKWMERGLDDMLRRLENGEEIAVDPDRVLRAMKDAAVGH